jgi:hypothetical protein
LPRNNRPLHPCDDATGAPRRIDAFLHDALTEVLLGAERNWWLRRAEDFERAKPRPAGEFYGQASRGQLRERWLRLDEMARACRARAHVSAEKCVRADVANVLREVA